MLLPKSHTTTIYGSIHKRCKTIIIGHVNLEANADSKKSREYITLLKNYDFEITNRIRTRNESNRIIDH